MNMLVTDVSGTSILASPAAGEGELLDASGRGISAGARIRT